MSTVITINVRPLVKKVILKSEATKEPISVQLNTFLGRLIHASVGKDTKKSKPADYDDYSETLTLELPTSITDYSYNRVKLSLVNETYYHKFKSDMFLFITAQRSAGLSIQNSIDNFLRYYNVKEEEYTPETVRREWNRYCQKQQKNLKSSPAFLS